ncbi:MAG TPA: hypothetical protein VKE41_14420 [Roseiflexaceae bacterium]|nr:hypothetical protein [Roseiflexaceae bacterium]
MVSEALPAAIARQIGVLVWRSLMLLTPREQEKLMIYVVADGATRTR